MEGSGRSTRLAALESMPGDGGAPEDPTGGEAAGPQPGAGSPHDMLSQIIDAAVQIIASLPPEEQQAWQQALAPAQQLLMQKQGGTPTPKMAPAGAEQGPPGGDMAAGPGAPPPQLGM